MTQPRVFTPLSPRLEALAQVLAASLAARQVKP